MNRRDKRDTHQRVLNTRILFAVAIAAQRSPTVGMKLNSLRLRSKRDGGKGRGKEKLTTTRQDNFRQIYDNFRKSYNVSVSLLM